MIDPSNNRVIIVGNGASLLGSGLGPAIDAHEIVVRFNRFETRDFVPDVGRKTTIWFCNRDVNHSSLLRVLHDESYSEIYAHTWGDEKAAAATFRKALKNMGKIAPVFEVSKQTYVEMRQFGETDYRFFSTGAIAIWLMIQRFGSVTLVGFDWWNKPERIHYFNDGQLPPDPKTGHRPGEEKRFFDRLERLGRLSYLKVP
ncbi:MAG: glycosyltransferase family 29 protein [Verrucomicrobiae bacterium]|nr:glycosyltransferase family 29 protein [Verrucomicrobiae bacterium]MCB1086920.1 glycosyltransferase family 29 protein [Verrucomicrobiae bacterium]